MLLSKWRFAMCWLMLAIFASMAPLTLAADPAIVVSVKSVEELLDDVTYIGEVIDKPDIGETFNALIGQMTQGKGLIGVDQTRPVGGFLVITEQGQPMPPVVFIPVKSEKQFTELLGMFFPEISKTKSGLVTLKGPLLSFPVVGKFQDGYFFASQTAPALIDLPAPADFVNAKADIAVELLLSKIPEPLKQAFLQQVAVTAENAVDRPSEPAEALGYDLGRKLALDSMISTVTDGDRLTLALNIDAEEGKFALDLGVSAVVGTNMAKSLAVYGQEGSKFAELLPADSLMTLTFATPLSQDIGDALGKLMEVAGEQAQAEIENDANLKTAAEKKVAKDIATELLSVMSATFKAGRIDFAVAVGGESEEDMTVLAFAKIVAGNKVNGIVDRLAAELKKESPKSEGLKFNVATIGTAKIHEATPSEEKEATNPIKGPVYLGIGDDFLLISGGGESLETAKASAAKLVAGKAVGIRPKSRTAKSRAPISLRMKLSKALALSKNLDADTIAEAQETYKDGGDEIAIEITAGKNSIQLHLEIEDGVLELGSSLASGAAGR